MSREKDDVCGKWSELGFSVGNNCEPQGNYYINAIYYYVFNF